MIPWSILIIDNTGKISGALQNTKYNMRLFHDENAAIQEIKNGYYDLVIINTEASGINIYSLVKIINLLKSSLKIVIIQGEEEIDSKKLPIRADIKFMLIDSSFRTDIAHILQS